MKNVSTIYTRLASYAGMGIVLLIALNGLPVPGGYIWEPWVINISTTLLFLLLVWLTARLARTDQTGLGVLLTGVFIMLFCPGVDQFFMRDEQALVELGSQCIVPFFFGQYRRIRRKDFTYWYFLMLLMGIFCSYTHSGLSIPLCISFMWVSFRHLKGFFRMACWPMVIGFAIGTTLSILQHNLLAPDGLLQPAEIIPMTLRNIPGTTWTVLTTLWDTKVFVLSAALTLYLASRQQGREMLLRLIRRNYAITVCLVAAFATMPLAPLGIDNAVQGVCFFCMFWLLFLAKYLAERYFDKRM